MLMQFVLALTMAGTSQSAVHASALAFSAPQQIVALEKIKGEPTELAWSPDGRQLYLETGERSRLGTFLNPRHYLINVTDQKVKSIDDAPQWAVDYNTWKANKWAPGDPQFAIAITEGTRSEHAISTPSGGALAKGGESGAAMGNMDEAVTAAITTETQHVITLKLKGETVGEYVDTQFVPGYTFGWAPKSIGTAIAYAKPDGHLAVMDGTGDKRTIDDSRNAFLPAWSTSGDRIAFVEHDGKKFDVFVTEVK